ncbi:MAG TPA: methyltransferase domain-containing protein [Pirellulaceae bacterium]
MGRLDERGKVWGNRTMDREELRGSVMYRTLSKLCEQGIVSPKDSFLLVFAGDFDRRVFEELGFRNYELTNVHGPRAHEPTVETADARSLPYPDESYDHVVAHAGIHHTSRPHQAVCEMYRCARKTAIFLEAQDSVPMRIAVRLGLVAEYEWNVIFDSGFSRGGVDDRPIPNHVYRWTSRELIKLLKSLDPTVEPTVTLFREWNVPFTRLARRPQRSPLRWIPPSVATRIFAFLGKALNFLLGHSGNSFAACIQKNRAKTKPWIVTTLGAPTFDSTSVTPPSSFSTPF